MSTITLQVLELVKSLPPTEQRTISAELARHTASLERAERRRLQRLPDGSYFNPEGIPNGDPIFRILEDIEEERHRTAGPPPPEFD